jgi:hypothetical protein
VVLTRLPERRSTVRPSRRLPSRKPLWSIGAFESGRRMTKPPWTRLRRQTVLPAVAPPRRSGPACWRRRQRRRSMGAAHEPFRPSAERRVVLGDVGQRGGRSMDPEQLRFAAGGELPRDNASQAERSRPRSKASARPTAATSAEATIAPNPGIVTRRLASSFSLAQRTNSASKASIRRSSSAHCARASATRRTIRGLNPAPLARPSARPGIAEASACPAARPSRVQAGWRAAD